MKRLLLAFLLAASSLLAQPSDCQNLTSLDLPNTRIESATTIPADGQTPAWCKVISVVTHPPAGDQIRVFTGLPLEDWNHRFQGRGGGGFSGGSERSLLAAVAGGFAAGSTDTGHTGGRGSFALDGKGRLNWTLIRDNAHVGIHEMTVTSKALVNAFYGEPARYSYFNGCSTGGRQGLSEAQRYPDDYDGILSGCPAINWPQLHGAQMWGQLVMLEADHVVPQCKFEAARLASIETCDAIDGVRDEVIEDPRRCTYDPAELIGTTPDACSPITAADADIIRKVWRGPRRRDGGFLWYGLPYGAASGGLVNTGGDPLTGKPFRITLDWFRYFLTQDPEWDWTTITRASYEHLWDQGMEQYRSVFGTDNPDLTRFRDRGGKAIVWHGWVDQLIYPEGTINYYERVTERMGGPEKTAEFIRLFMAPGVAHCRRGNGPQPDGHFEALIKWVEEGIAPDTLDAVLRDESGDVTRTRPLCPYPQVAQYKGSGSTDDAANFTCITPPQLEQTDVYRSGEGGYHTYRIPSLIVTKSGTVLAFAEGRKRGRGDSGNIDLLVKRSADGGRTWSPQTVVWDDGANTCGNPCPVVDQTTGRIVLTATWNRGDDHGRDLHQGKGKGTRRVFVLNSDNDGRSWTPAREITSAAKAPDWWWYATGPGVGIQLRQGPHAGRLVIPANHSSAANGFGAHTIYSDDGGETWHRSNAIKPACNESQVVELAGGRLMMNMRSQSPTNAERTGYRSIAFSSDGGATWSAPEFDQHLGDPVVQASILRYGLASEDGRNRLLFANPSPPVSPERGRRIRMTVRLSYDEGKTWPVSKVVHPGPSAYSCLTRLPDGSVGLLYEGGETNGYDRLILARFPIDWLEW